MEEEAIANANDAADNDPVVSSISDVTKENFVDQSNDLIQRISNAAWIAVDEEMTGISLPGTPRPSKADTPADRYSTLKKVSERYSIIQLGLCLFEEAGITETPDGGERMSFHVRRYKFTLFPPADNRMAREVTFNPSSIQFLAQNNMSFDHMVKSGIPYITKQDAEGLMDKYYEKQTEDDSGEKKTPSRGRSKVKLVHPEDRNLHARSMAALREWLDAAIQNHDEAENAPPEGMSMLLPPCNSFLRRALYESIEAEYPNLVLETQNSQIRVLRLNAEERTRRKARLQREGWENILQEKLGVYRVFLALTKACNGSSTSSQAEHMILASSVDEALTTFKPEDPAEGTARKVPLVVHNGLQDLLFLLTHFHNANLPESWHDCKQLIHSYFPVIYDTKCMATEHGSRENSRTPTHLSAVYEQTLSSHPQWNRTFQNGGDDDEQQQAHDAGWDAYMTGAAFCGLSYTIHDFLQFPPVQSCRSQFKLWNCDPNDEAFANMYGRNKIHFHLSPYTIDLESPGSDPMVNGMSRESTYRVAGIDSSVTTRDIMRCLTGLNDSDGVRVNYEIIWIDDTSFLAGAKIPNCEDKELLLKHGMIIENALSATFRGGEVIETVKDDASNKKEPQYSGSIWNLWGIFGIQKKRCSIDNDDPAPNAKRRRTS
ncbi:unnamed protein product [Cylindrotheca closterium]|uniref:Uncharacterized protein n=1 Tax=Cylindrotheca closterium TaxID=2856 RepID=A0AAD2D016_9STRA|nr:unnamed protein product [Cylindrotheca closterium]